MRALTEQDLSYQYWPFYAQAYLNDFHLTALSMAAEACFHRLCARQWIAPGGLLPADPAVVRALTKASGPEWKRLWRELEPLFPLVDDGAGRRYAPLWALRLEREAYIEKQRKNGKHGGRPRSNPELSETEPENNPHQNPRRKPARTQQKPTGFGSDHPTQNPTGNPISNPLETLELVVGDIPPSPSPGGEGASPAAAPPLAVVADAPEHSEALLPSETLAEYRQRMRGAAAKHEAEQLAAIEHAEARAAVARFLAEQRVLADRIPNWVRRIAGWVNGLGTSGMRPVTWEAVVLGIEELLDTNPPGQSIRPQEMLTFVESAQRRLTSTPAPAKRAGPDAEREREEAHRKVLIEYAQNGDQDAIAECEKLGLDYRSVA